MLSLLNFLQNLINDYKIAGIVIGAFLSSSILPLPSEAVIVSAGLIGIPPLLIGIFGGIGSTFGSLVGYEIGRGGKIFIEKYGKYFFVNANGLKLFEKWFEKWGNFSVLIGRIIPFVPYKVFSVGCGLCSMKIKNYFLLTLLGSIPRCFLLSSFGFLISLSKNVYLSIFSLAIFFLVPLIVEKISSPGRIFV